MKRLNDTWLTEGLLDFEYKKYVLLAWLQEVEQQFGAVKIYPSLSDLIFHYENLQQFSDTKSLLEKSFPKEIAQADLAQMKLEYSSKIQKTSDIQELEEIIAYSMPALKKYIDEGRGLYQLVESNIAIEPIGLVPLHKEAGYAMLHYAAQREVEVYSFNLSIFQSVDGETMRGMNMRFVDRYPITITSTLENIKLQLIRAHRELPNPATYLVDSRLAVPFQETILPIAKRMLVRYILTQE